MDSCLWKQEDDWDNSAMWNTSCGQAFMLEEGTPTMNSMRHCCYCGKPLVEETAIRAEGKQQ